MKSTLYILTLTGFAIIGCLHGMAHPVAGIYLHASDYRNRNTCPFVQRVKIIPHRLFDSRHIIMKTGNARLRYDKDSIFGYRNGKGEDFRFYAGEEYRIVETATLVIYAGTEPAYTAKGYRSAPVYFFSRTLDSEIMPLSVINVKRAYPEHLRLHHYLDIFFYNTAADTYDETHHIFCMNYLLQYLKETAHQQH